ncbi:MULTISPECIES: hypothetical protein [Haloferax]|uniref:Uncharacterized protein n=1 Tax=Haloferax marinum TaxID=2666143 RepID=A0A6A8G9F4_9EURY|nr:MULTISPECIES: hypothetical protein [Haloferax]MRW97819.1 hypothetical protein [Haloferax marinum]
MFEGTLVQPEEPEYDHARVLWNGMIDEYPLLIDLSGTTNAVVDTTTRRVGVQGG